MDLLELIKLLADQAEKIDTQQLAKSLRIVCESLRVVYSQLKALWIWNMILTGILAWLFYQYLKLTERVKELSGIKKPGKEKEVPV